MKKSDIKAGGEYIAKDHGKLTVVRVDAIRGNNYTATNLATGRKTRFHSAAKFLAVATPETAPSEGAIEGSAASVLKLFDSALPAVREYAARQIARAMTTVTVESSDLPRNYGTLRVSLEDVVWLPYNTKYAYRLALRDFDRMIQGNGERLHCSQVAEPSSVMLIGCGIPTR